MWNSVQSLNGEILPWPQEWLLLLVTSKIMLSGTHTKKLSSVGACCLSSNSTHKLHYWWVLWVIPLLTWHGHVQNITLHFIYSRGNERMLLETRPGWQWGSWGRIAWISGSVTSVLEGVSPWYLLVWELCLLVTLRSRPHCAPHSSEAEVSYSLPLPVMPIWPSQPYSKGLD